MSTKRYIVDTRTGCAAIIDIHHPRYDPEYQGLHSDTKGVIVYENGIRTSDGWKMEDAAIKKLKNECSRLNTEYENTLVISPLTEDKKHNRYVMEIRNESTIEFLKLKIQDVIDEHLKPYAKDIIDESNTKNNLIDLELIIRRENGNDLEMAQRIINEYSKLKTQQ